MNELETTKKWFEAAIPEPTDEQKSIQIGVHLEEVHEMDEVLQMMDVYTIEDLADYYKSAPQCEVDIFNHISEEHKVKLLDSLADQIVTAIGVAHMFGFDIEGALAEVNRSNFSKFEDGVAVFNENGKITKGKHYTPPDLTPYI